MSMTKKNTIEFLLPGLMLTVFVLCFISIFQKMAYQWSSGGDDDYCYLIIPLFLYLCWEKKASFHFDRFTWNGWGVLPVALSILIIFTGELGSITTFVFIGIWGCLAGMMFTVYGSRIRQIWFPLLILAFIVPLPPFINRMLTFNLKLTASSLAVSVLRLAGVSVFQEGNIINLGITQLQVVDACSGLRYLMPLFLMALLFGYFYCRKWWQNAILISSVAPLSIVVNGIRIFFTGMLHIWGKPELAENFFHDFSGWFVFMIAAAILLGISLLLRRMDKSKNKYAEQLEIGGAQIAVGNEKKEPTNWRPQAFSTWRKQVTLTVTLCLMFMGSGYALHWLPSAANMPERSTFETFPMALGNWEATRDYLSQKILNELWPDDYVSATYYTSDRRHAVHLLISFYEHQETHHTAHAPQSCMLGGGWTLLASKERTVATTDGGHFPIMVSIWEKNGIKILGSYFFFQRGRTITSPWMNKYWLMMDAFGKQRTDGALVRAEMTLAPNQSIDDAYRLLDDFLIRLHGILPTYVPV